MTFAAPGTCWMRGRYAISSTNHRRNVGSSEIRIFSKLMWSVRIVVSVGSRIFAMSLMEPTIA